MHQSLTYERWHKRPPSAARANVGVAAYIFIAYIYKYMYAVPVCRYTYMQVSMHLVNVLPKSTHIAF